MHSPQVDRRVRGGREPQGLFIHREQAFFRKILKKHDKNSTFKSRGTINNAISHLSFYRQRDLSEVIATVECLWKVFIGDKKSKRMNDLKNVYSRKPALNGFVVGINVVGSEVCEA